MVHPNFRRLVRKLASTSTGSTSNPPYIYDYIDTNGRTGSSNESAFCDTISANNICLGHTNWTDASVETTFTYHANSKLLFLWALVGNSIDEDEPDYTLGEIISNNIKIYTTFSKDDELIVTTNIYNTGDTDITFNEVGFFAHIVSNSGNWPSDTTTKYANFMLIKEVLNEPGVIPANSSISIDFNLLGDEI